FPQKKERFSLNQLLFRAPAEQRNLDFSSSAIHHANVVNISRQPPAASRQPPTARRQPPAANRQTPAASRQTPDARRVNTGVLFFLVS
ncbi:MAG TPA: hypothetical protein PLT12_10530, partial [Kiritimatiellia bacterium]|nr:hypothetical protein [Kiritimatiellia bacterium]HOR75273.1 hypothetical protein [Kiritimatiellia bacterium]HOU60052.1 hypothetical protein [Kiritimatiellia bacterium]HPK70285.1 hypothetical protein [Kiritimatiellia bacterium]HQM24256.1 hypothetical protein [Kiritimatiellia bacterium]